MVRGLGWTRHVDLGAAMPSPSGRSRAKYGAMERPYDFLSAATQLTSCGEPSKDALLQAESSFALHAALIGFCFAKKP